MATAPELVNTSSGSAPEIEIRAMRDADVSVAAAVESTSYQFPWSEGIFRDCVRVGYLCRVVELSGVVIGHGIVSTGAGEAHILNVCVRPEFRCRGIGRQLLRYLLDRSRALGMAEAFLEVRPSNTSAIRLYQSLGFEQVGVRRGYYQATNGREDATVLRLALSQL